ncbi:hypothetical protein NKH18_46260 [Streptomyces sp. M10(2022)]
MTDGCAAQLGSGRPRSAAGTRSWAPPSSSKESPRTFCTTRTASSTPTAHLPATGFPAVPPASAPAWSRGSSPTPAWTG